jgi:hypothetical protein
MPLGRRLEKAWGIVRHSQPLMNNSSRESLVRFHLYRTAERNSKQDSLITFLSKKIVQTGSNTFDVPRDFTIRGASKPETLTLTVSGEGTDSGEIHGTMAFDRRDYGMTKGIPFVKIADTVDGDCRPQGEASVSGPPLVFKQ